MNLISWISSFLEDRVLRLLFDSKTKEFSLINTGIPQGSPILPIFFLIYIRDLFPKLAAKLLSYIDNILLIVVLTSLKKNIYICNNPIPDIGIIATEGVVHMRPIR
jgi:hypothetical protein